MNFRLNLSGVNFWENQYKVEPLFGALQFIRAKLKVFILFHGDDSLVGCIVFSKQNVVFSMFSP
jgi:hypothetical protein